MNEETVAALADDLLEATRDVGTIPPLRTRYPAMTVDDAYAVQLRQLRRAEASGRRIVGRKVGLTSRAMQEQLGIDSPDFGYVLDDMVYSDGDAVPVLRFVAPRIEPELAFHLRAPLSGRVTRKQAVAAVGGVFAAMEIIDSRIADWDIGLVDTVADNASCGAVVLGREPLDLDPAGTSAVGVTMALDGAVVERGTGDAVLGDPIAPLAWLAATLDAYGAGLEEGDFVLTGSFCRALPVAAGTRVVADYGVHGPLSVRFV